MYGVPQGSILGPLLFTLFIAPLQNVNSSYNLHSLFSADDFQLYISVKPLSPNVALDLLSDCISAVLNWNTQNKLQTNLGKTSSLNVSFSKCLSCCLTRPKQLPIVTSNFPGDLRKVVHMRTFLTFFVACMLDYMQTFWSRSRQSVSYYHYGGKQTHLYDRECRLLRGS